jgi:hypothetical protein
MGWSATLQSGVVCVVDDGRDRSVTNDAEQVIQQLTRWFDLSKRRVIYQDTTGTWDGMAVRANQFAGFIPIQSTDRSEAIQAALGWSTTNRSET